MAARCLLAFAVLAAVLAPAVGTAVSTFEVGAAGDLCNGTCEFRLCLGGSDLSRLEECDEASFAEPGVVVRMSGFEVESPGGSGPRRPDLRLRLLGVRAALTCDNSVLAPCQSRCGTDDVCAANGPLSRCIDGYCAATTTCPGRGRYPGIASYKKSEVVAFSDSCTNLCEFRLCLSGRRLVPCADVPPAVVVRVPYRGRGTRRRLPPLVLKYGRRRLVLTCQHAPRCLALCTTDDECFPGGWCECIAAGSCEEARYGYCKSNVSCR